MIFFMTMNEEQHLPYADLDPIEKLETRYTYAAVVEAVRCYVPNGGSVLDIGCGRGELMQRLGSSGYAVQGCDVDKECVTLSSRYGEVLEGDLLDISTASFPDKFDCVVMSHVIEHTENPREAVTRAASLSKGILVISVPNPYNTQDVFRSVARIKIKKRYANPRHLYAWDWVHFKTFIERGCGLEILNYFYDLVELPLPHRGRCYLAERGLLEPLEGKLLRSLFPRFCNSITAAISVFGNEAAS